MDGLRSAQAAGGPPLQLFNCTFANCGATFTRQWKLKEHETVHTGTVSEANPLPHADSNMTARFNFEPFAVAMSVPCCWLRSSILQEVSPEPPHASAHRSQTIQVSQGPTILLRPSPVTHFVSFSRCKVPACNLSFFNAGKLKRHERFRHEDKNKYFKVCQFALLSTRGRQDSSKLQVTDVDRCVLGLSSF